MKLRLHGNSIRLRLNRREVNGLASGNTLEERILFPDNGRLSYVLEPIRQGGAAARFHGGVVRIAAPFDAVAKWASSDDLGLYFDFTVGEKPLKVAIEKDLECLHGPEEVHDPEAFPRT